MPAGRTTHSDLVILAINWLKGTRRCGSVLAELSSVRREIPDAIGWAARGASILVECKASRSDFLKDALKPFRTSNTGMGRERWFMVLPGVVKDLEEVPAGWGVLEVHGNKIRKLKAAKPQALAPAGMQRESFLLSCALARVQGRGSAAPVVDPAGFMAERQALSRELREEPQASAMPALVSTRDEVTETRRDVLQRKVRGQVRSINRTAYKLPMDDLRSLAGHLSALERDARGKASSASRNH